MKDRPMPERRRDRVKKTVKIIGCAAAAVFISLAAAFAAGGIGLGFSFLVFGDGSELYFWLEKMLPADPYFIVPAVYFIVVFAGVLTAVVMLIKKIIRF